MPSENPSLIVLALGALLASACTGTNSSPAAAAGGAAGSGASGGAAGGSAGSGAAGASGSPGAAGAGGSPGAAGAGGSPGSGGSARSGLLSGCTVTANNQPTCATPAGWTLVTAQGFDSGGLPSDQYLCNGASSSPETIESGFAHTGNHAVGGGYTGGDQQICWTLKGASIDSLTTYVSWWEYDESQGKLNQDFFLSRRNISSLARDAELQFAASGCLFNCDSQSLYFEPHGGGWSVYQGNTSPGWGAWTQWEMYMSINPSGRATGEVQAWRNGVSVFHFTNKDIATHYTGWKTADLAVGGVYTKLVWWRDSAHTQCATGHSNYTTNFGDWTKPDPCPDQAPPDGHVPSFKRYFDDIIVLKK